MNRIVAIDGAAGTGKSTVASRLACELNWVYLNTGLYYRVATYYCLAQEVPLADEISVHCAIGQLVAQTRSGIGITISLNPQFPNVKIGETDVTDKLWTPELTEQIHYISSLTSARQLLVELQQEVVNRNSTSGIVVEGRDVTDIVAPQAQVRVLLTACDDVRANRRAWQLNLPTEDVKHRILKRDAIDSQVNQFQKPTDDGVTVIDTSTLTINQVVEQIHSLIKCQH